MKVFNAKVLFHAKKHKEQRCKEIRFFSFSILRRIPHIDTLSPYAGLRGTTPASINYPNLTLKYIAPIFHMME